MEKHADTSGKEKPLCFVRERWPDVAWLEMGLAGEGCCAWADIEGPNGVTSGWKLGLQKIENGPYFGPHYKSGLACKKPKITKIIK